MKILIALVLVFTLYACNSSKPEISETLTPTAFADELKTNSEIVLLDVRTPEEVQAGIIAGAKNINYNAESFAHSLDSLDHSKTYFVYCAAGKRSGKALDLMKEKGFQHVTSLEGGIKSWTSNGLPVTKP